MVSLNVYCKNLILTGTSGLLLQQHRYGLRVGKIAVWRENSFNFKTTHTGVGFDGCLDALHFACYLLDVKQTNKYTRWNRKLLIWGWLFLHAFVNKYNRAICAVSDGAGGLCVLSDLIVSSKCFICLINGAFITLDLIILNAVLLPPEYSSNHHLTKSSVSNVTVTISGVINYIIFKFTYPLFTKSGALVLDKIALN